MSDVSVMMLGPALDEFILAADVGISEVGIVVVGSGLGIFVSSLLVVGLAVGVSNEGLMVAGSADVEFHGVFHVDAVMFVAEVDGVSSGVVGIGGSTKRKVRS